MTAKLYLLHEKKKAEEAEKGVFYIHSSVPLLTAFLFAPLIMNPVLRDWFENSARTAIINLGMFAGTVWFGYYLYQLPFRPERGINSGRFTAGEFLPLTVKTFTVIMTAIIIISAIFRAFKFYFS